MPAAAFLGVEPAIRYRQINETALGRRELAGVEISAKRIHRMTSQTGAERCDECTAAVDAFRNLPLVQRTSANPVANVPDLGVVMMDGGRHQRRDHFGQPRGSDHSTHWKEDKVGLCLSMHSDEHQCDPAHARRDLCEHGIGRSALISSQSIRNKQPLVAPEFPDWLSDAKVVRNQRLYVLNTFCVGGC